MDYFCFEEDTEFYLQIWEKRSSGIAVDLRLEWVVEFGVRKLQMGYHLAEVTRKSALVQLQHTKFKICASFSTA